MLKLLKDSNHGLGQAILMITHDSDAAGLWWRVVKMRDGCIVKELELFDKSSRAFQITCILTWSAIHFGNPSQNE